MAAYGTFDSRERDGQGSSSSSICERESRDGVPRKNDGTGSKGSATTAATTWMLITFYTSHALFMWNNRSYEFASVLFTAAAFPGTLVAASIRGLSAHLASLIFSPSVGRWCNNHPSRLRPVQVCIVAQRLSIALASLVWMSIVDVLEANPALGGSPVAQSSKIVAFAILMVLGMVERLSAVGNIIVVEQDWLPLLASEASTNTPTVQTCAHSASDHVQCQEDGATSTGRSSPKLHLLNATTKRIDLITKLVAPIVVSAMALGLESVRWTAALLAISQVLSCWLEMYLTQQVWTSCPALQSAKPKVSWKVSPGCDGEGPATTESEDPGSRPLPSRPGVVHHVVRPLVQSLGAWINSLKSYFTNSTCLASLAYALEPFSVLTMAGSMSAYLLVAHVPLTIITAARAASTIVEISSTVITPILISWLSGSEKASKSLHDIRQFRALMRVGLLGLSWQAICLMPATIALVILPSLDESGFGAGLSSYSTPTIAMFATLALSRLGPFAYSLAEQQIVQLEVPEHERVEFSGVEMALFDFFEVARWGMLGFFGNPDQFRWVALVSFGTILLSLGMFVTWVRRKSSQAYQVVAAATYTVQR